MSTLRVVPARHQTLVERVAATVRAEMARAQITQQEMAAILGVTQFVQGCAVMTQIECGTDKGYWRHYRRREPVCDACRAAHAQELLDRGETRPARHCGCGRRMQSRTHDKCYVCRTGRVKPVVKPKTTPAEIEWAKDHAGVFRAVTVIDPEPDGPRRFHTDAGVVC